MLTPLGACRARTQTSAVVKSGFLDKKSRRYRTYSRYWFVLRGDRLTYYYDAQVQPSYLAHCGQTVGDFVRLPV